jgi:hypothetical protein
MRFSRAHRDRLWELAQSSCGRAPSPRVARLLPSSWRRGEFAGRIGTMAFDSQETKAFCEFSGVRPMTEVYPLAHA